VHGSERVASSVVIDCGTRQDTEQAMLTSDSIDFINIVIGHNVYQVLFSEANSSSQGNRLLKYNFDRTTKDN